MRGTIKLPDLIEEIYDAALEPALWNDVIVSINDFIGSRGCGLVSKDLTSRCGTTICYHGIDPHYIELYSKTHSRFDPLVTLPAPGHVVGIPDLVDYDEYRRGPFYQEWLRPQNSFDVANALLEKSGPKRGILLAAVPRARMLDADMRRRIGAVAPHARRALLINKAIESRQSEAATFSNALNGLGAGVFLVDTGCRVVHANAAGHELLRAGGLLRSVNGQVAARDTHVNRALREICTDSGIASIGVRGISLPLAAHDGERYVVHVLPLTSSDRTVTGMAYKAVAALFVRKVALERPSGDLLARTFELTPAETRVLLSIVEVGGVPETATALGVAETTVKTHLHRVFHKTGTSRQADLVKVATGFFNPLMN
jgi:DNA-binding CsgD family transcriptional regulator/PAS domain-containing protein